MTIPKDRASRFIWQDDDIEVTGGQVAEATPLGPPRRERIVEHSGEFIRIEEYNKYHDAKGRFAPGGPSGGGKLDTKTLAGQANAGLDEGGFSLDVSGNSPSTGIMVSFDAKDGHGVVIDATMDRPAREAALRDWVSKQRKFVGNDPENYFGGWIDNGKAYLDVSHRFPKEQRDKAIEAGKSQNQIAVFDLDTFTEIPTGGTGE